MNGPTTILAGPPHRRTQGLGAFNAPFLASSVHKKLFMAWLNRWTVRLEHCHKSPKLRIVAEHLTDAHFRCFIIAAVKLDSAN